MKNNENDNHDKHDPVQCVISRKLEELERFKKFAQRLTVKIQVDNGKIAIDHLPERLVQINSEEQETTGFSSRIPELLPTTPWTIGIASYLYKKKKDPLMGITGDSSKIKIIIEEVED